MPRGAAFAFASAFAFAAVILSGAGPAHAEPSMEAIEPYLFSPAWRQDFGEAEDLCRLGRGSYTWRTHGFGSNVNSESVHGSASPRSCRA